MKQKDKEIFEKALHGIQFATGKDVITKNSYPILDAVVMIMKENPSYFLEINGHTDNVGKVASNQVLSEKRATAVKNYLIKKGIAEDRLSSQGFGDTKPLVPNTTAANKAKNRRVEFIVKYEK
ncbi:MAG: OmpA family protein [Dysgonamonadaceae bacterium]|nr:OmpA family protein [Dysgonamonadaceae bacterium]